VNDPVTWKDLLILVLLSELILIGFTIVYPHATPVPIAEPPFLTNCVLWDTVRVDPDTLIWLSLKETPRGDTVISQVTQWQGYGLETIWPGLWYSSNHVIQDYYDMLGELNARKEGIRP